MPLCKCCHRRDRDQIDQQIVAGVPLRTLAAATGISLGALHRHKSCIKELLRDAAQSNHDETETHASSLLNRVEKLADEAEQLVAIAKTEKNYHGATSALVAACKLLDLCGRLSGELQQANAAGGGLHLHKHTTINITNFDNDVDFAAMIGEATRGFSVAELMRLKAIAEGTSNTSVHSVCNARPKAMIVDALE